MEMHAAWMAGRADKDPSLFWYQGELGFFDHYIIPLASKLFKCGVLKVSNDELVAYARNNRTEWEIKGQVIVAEMKEKAMKQGMPKEINAPPECALPSMNMLDLDASMASKPSRRSSFSLGASRSGPKEFDV